MRRILTQFQRAQIGCAAGKAIGDIGQDHAVIDRGGARLEPEINVLGLVKRLNFLHILGIQRRDIDEDVVIDDDAMLILSSRLAEFGQGRELARLERFVGSGAAGKEASVICPYGQRTRSV